MASIDNWEGALLGYPPENPYLLAGFHSEEDLDDPAWLEEAQRTWSGDLCASVLADALRVLETVVLPPEPGDREDEEHPAPLEEPESNAADTGNWLH